MMRAEYREGESFSHLDFTEETFYDCDFSDCTFIDCTFENCKLDHSVLSECQFIRCTITGLKTTMSRAKLQNFKTAPSTISTGCPCRETARLLTRSKNCRTAA